MLKFIIRLDDACPTMNEENWIKIEELLNKYNIKPIVGIIPDNKDEAFSYPLIKDFWTKYAQKWQNKGWIIAQHGCYHKYTYINNVRTEFYGKDIKEQEKLISTGLKKLKSHQIYPKCFFAPNHTFDDVTIEVCKKLNCFEFISDGYAFNPYKQNGVLFFPSVFDTPHKISNKGIFTFVFHPNTITEKKLENLENFIKNNLDNFDVNIDEIIEKYQNRKINIKDKILHIMINLYRFIFKKKIK